MLALKNQLSEKLSSLFADSPNNYSSTSLPASDHSQARSYNERRKSLSSLFSFIVPKSNENNKDLKPLQSLPVRWKSKTFELEDESLDCYKECTAFCKTEDSRKDSQNNQKSSPTTEKKQTVCTHDDDEGGATARSSSDSDVFQEANDQQSPGKPLADLTDDSAFINPDIYEFLQSSLPNIVKGCQWILVYSTLKHGISLRTLIRKSAELSGPSILIAGDMQGVVFGAMLECPLKPTPKRKYQGTNQTFVFTTLYGEPRLFRPTGVNRFYYMCLNDMLALGGGDDFALRLDGDLLSGTSGPCETFGNLCLAHKPEFELKNVELWGFVHVSQYLT